MDTIYCGQNIGANINCWQNIAIKFFLIFFWGEGQIDLGVTFLGVQICVVQYFLGGRNLFEVKQIHGQNLLGEKIGGVKIFRDYIFWGVNIFWGRNL